jgi:hypothetical protein
LLALLRAYLILHVSRIRVKNECNNTFTPAIYPHGVDRDNFTLYSTANIMLVIPYTLSLHFFFQSHRVMYGKPSNPSIPHCTLQMILMKITA